MSRHANHLLSADYINYGEISIQIKDKFLLEVPQYTNEGKTTPDNAMPREHDGPVRFLSTIGLNRYAV